MMTFLLHQKATMKGNLGAPGKFQGNNPMAWMLYAHLLLDVIDGRQIEAEQSPCHPLEQARPLWVRGTA